MEFWSTFNATFVELLWGLDGAFDGAAEGGVVEIMIPLTKSQPSLNFANLAPISSAIAASPCYLTIILL